MKIFPSLFPSKHLPRLELRFHHKLDLRNNDWSMLSGILQFHILLSVTSMATILRGGAVLQLFMTVSRCVEVWCWAFCPALSVLPTLTHLSVTTTQHTQYYLLTTASRKPAFLNVQIGTVSLNAWKVRTPHKGFMRDVHELYLIA